jgi:small subunit ribosomal protein S14
MATTSKIAKGIKRRSSRFGCATAAACAAGRARYMRKFALCRLCFRKLALEGDVTGVTRVVGDEFTVTARQVTDCQLSTVNCRTETERTI